MVCSWRICASSSALDSHSTNLGRAVGLGAVVCRGWRRGRVQNSLEDKLRREIEIFEVFVNGFLDLVLDQGIDL